MCFAFDRKFKDQHMATFTRCKHAKTTVVLDGHQFTDCEFEDCTIIVTRGNFFLKGCTFTRCKFEFGGEAANIRNIVLGLEGGKQ